MTSDESVTSKAELNAKIRELLATAHENDIDVKGGYECRNGPESPDWDVIVTELAKSHRAE